LLLVGAEWLADGDFRIVEVAPLGPILWYPRTVEGSARWSTRASALNDLTWRSIFARSARRGIAPKSAAGHASGPPGYFSARAEYGT
jgi:hypothetical protein